MSLEGRRLTLNDSITMIKEWINGALRPLGVRVTGPGPQTFEVDDGWPEERRYWEVQIRTYYQAQFGPGLHPLQTDSAIVPPVKLATTIQGANKADPDGFFASGYRTILGYLAELRDYGVSPTDMGAHPRNGCGAWAAHGASVPLPGRTAWLRRDGACAGMDSFKTRPTHRIALDQPRTFIALSGRALRLCLCQFGAHSHPVCNDESMGRRTSAGRSTRGHGHRFGPGPEPLSAPLKYREYDSTYYRPGCHCWNLEAGVLMTSYQSREFLRSIFGAEFSILELRPHFRDTSHLICRRDL